MVMAMGIGGVHPAPLAQAAEDAAATAQGGMPAVQPEAGELYRAMCSNLESAKAFTVHADVAYDQVLDSGAKLQFAAAADLSVRRPDHVMVDYRGDLDSKKLWYDGKTLTLLNVPERLYSQTTAPASIDAMVAAVSREYGLTFPMGELLLDDLYEKTMAHVRGGIVVGAASVDGVDCTHLAFAEDAADWQVWIDKSDHPLPRKLLVTYKHMRGQPQYEARLSRWDMAPKLSDARFEAETGAAKQISFLPLQAPAPAEQGNGASQ